MDRSTVSMVVSAVTQVYETDGLVLLTTPNLLEPKNQVDPTHSSVNPTTIMVVPVLKTADSHGIVRVVIVIKVSVVCIVVAETAGTTVYLYLSAVAIVTLVTVQVSITVVVTVLPGFMVALKTLHPRIVLVGSKVVLDIHVFGVTAVRVQENSQIFMVDTYFMVSA